MLTNPPQMSLDEQLVQACIDFDIATIESLLNKGADPNFLTVREFIEDKHFYTPYLKTPLDIILCEYLTVSKSELEVTQVAKLLLDHGANPQGGTSGENLTTPLHEAIESKNVSLIQLLIERGADVNAPNGDGHETPLHRACDRFANFEIFELLIQHGADLNNQNEFGETPINLLIKEYGGPKYSNVDMTPQFELLIQQGSDLSIVDLEQKSPWSLMQNRPDLKIALINTLKESDNKIESLDSIIEAHLASIYPENILEYKLIQATTDLDIDKMTSLLEQGANPDFLAPRTYYPDVKASALHLLSFNFYLHQETGEPTLSAIKVLLEHGANPNIVNEDGSSPLHYLAEFANRYTFYDQEEMLSAMEVMLDNGANPNLENTHGDSPLHIFSESIHGKLLYPGEIEIFNLMLKHGGDLSLKNHDGHMPLDDLTGMSNFSTLKIYHNEENTVNEQPEEVHTNVTVIEAPIEINYPTNETKVVTPNNDTVLLLEEIIQVDARDIVLGEIQPQLQEITIINEAKPCPTYEGYMPSFIVKWFNLEPTCDTPNGTVVS